MTAILQRDQLVKLARYGVVGLASTGTYFVVFMGLIEGMDASVPAAASAGFLCGTVVSYLGNALWSFEHGVSTRSMVRFLSVIGATFFVNLALAAGLSAAGISPTLVFLAEVVTLTSLNFIGHSLWSFRTA